MATIYLIDNKLDILKIYNCDYNSAIARARGILIVHSKCKHNDLDEYWDDGMDWLRVKNTNTYALVKQ